jgi:glucose-6-phosphate 1-dehydrogenase
MSTEPFSLIIFGITSNLAQIKLIPALYDLEKNQMLPEGTKIFGVSRHSTSETEFVEYFKTVLNQENRHHTHSIDQAVFDRLVTRIKHVEGHFEESSLYQNLRDITTNNRIFYLATYPNLYQTIFTNLHQAGLSQQQEGWTRLVIEKPIGTNLESAQKLNALLLEYFTEDQIYRLDHYLGKETLQNIIDFRFGNGIFEPLMNTNHLDHIQVTASEDFGVGKRGGYFDSVGALKDVGQNHILQMIALTTMDDPQVFDNKAITNKRVELLRELVPMPDQTFFGQYEGYTREEKVATNSTADTFFAFKTEIKNDRFAGVPIYVRSGKKLNRTVTEVTFVFKLPRNRIFAKIAGGLEPNALIYRIQPNEGIVLKILTRKPGTNNEIEPTYMQFCYHQLRNEPTDPYERLIMDVLHGDQTFFNDADEIEAQWRFTDPLVQERQKPIIYSPGGWGPTEAEALIQRDGRAWMEPSTAFCLL